MHGPLRFPQWASYLQSTNTTDSLHLRCKRQRPSSRTDHTIPRGGTQPARAGAAASPGRPRGGARPVPLRLVRLFRLAGVRGAEIEGLEPPLSSVVCSTAMASKRNMLLCSESRCLGFVPRSSSQEAACEARPTLATTLRALLSHVIW